MKKSRKTPRITNIEDLGGLRLRLSFSDAACGTIDFQQVYEGAPGLLGELTEPQVFETVRVVDGVLTWANGVDLDPLVVYCRATGHKISEFFPGADDSILEVSRPRP